MQLRPKKDSRSCPSPVFGSSSSNHRQSGPQSVAQLLATFSASCCVKFDTLPMLLLLLLSSLLLLLFLSVMTTQSSCQTHGQHLSFVCCCCCCLLLLLLLLCLGLIYVRQFYRQANCSCSWLGLPNLCAFVIFACGLITIIHKYGQCVVNNNAAKCLRPQSHCMPCKNHNKKKQRTHNQATN